MTAREILAVLVLVGIAALILAGVAWRCDRRVAGTPRPSGLDPDLEASLTEARSDLERWP